MNANSKLEVPNSKMVQVKNTDQDEDLLYFFKNFDKILDPSKTPTIKAVSQGADFRVFSEYFIKDIYDIQSRLTNADDEYLLYVCEHLFNLIDWLRLILENRNPVFGDALETLFDNEFGDSRIWHTIYDQCFEAWAQGKEGQYRVGMNTYSIVNDALYYRNRFGQWFKIDKAEAFDVKPPQTSLGDSSLVSRLDKNYQATPYDSVLERWQNANYQGTLPPDFSIFDKNTTSPEEYFAFTLKNIQHLLDNPVSITELERWYGEPITDLEDTVKLCTSALDIIKARRKDDNFTVYLLRDCMIFYELDKTLNILNKEEAQSGHLLVGRSALSHKNGQWGYYIVILEALYEAHLRYPTDFPNFYREFSRLLDLFASVNEGFRDIIDNVAEYVRARIQTSKKKVVIFDVGFQGSINLFVKYVIDKHIHPTSADSDIQTDIEVSVGAEWSRELFGDISLGYYFPFLNRFQQLTRSDELYHYQFGSLKNGQVKITMADAQHQRKAAVELAVLVTVARLAQ